ncbi:INTS1 [Branchiostoma lanceolatum]|uniref:INTS1 protein n=1 Tax=Branchiostoma lanceolatum TaxID=7740 RepID=A0A8K0ACK0_BRALA|nr:INTS1 [Branchiostoma lanceolatum]
MDRGKLGGPRKTKPKGPPPTGELIALGSKPTPMATDPKLPSQQRKLSATGSSLLPSSSSAFAAKKPKLGVLTPLGRPAEGPKKPLVPTRESSVAPILVPASDLIDSILDAEAENNDDRVDSLIVGAINTLKSNKAKPDQAVFLSLMFLAKTKPLIFLSEGVTESFCSLLKRDVSFNFKSKGNPLVVVLTCNILMSAYQEEDNWPDNFVKVFVEDSLGERVWVDNPECKEFVANIQTAFNTRLPTKSGLTSDPSGRPPSSTPEHCPSPTQFGDDDDRGSDLSEGLTTSERLTPDDQSITPRYTFMQESIEGYILDTLKDQLTRRQAMDNLSRNLIRLMTVTCGYAEVRLMAVQRLEMWLQNPKLTRPAQELLMSVCLKCVTQDPQDLTRPAQELLMSVCLNCVTQDPQDVEVVSALIRVRLKTKPLINHYNSCMRELLNAHSENLSLVLKHTIYNELSNSRNPNNMSLLAVLFQHSPEEAAKFLAVVFQELLTNREDYLRAVRALLREIIRALRGDLNFAAFCRSLMQERSESQFMEMEGHLKERLLLQLTDLICLGCLLSVTAAVKEAASALARGEKKVDLETLRRFQLQSSVIQRDSVWWLHTIAPGMFKLNSTDYVQCIQKVLFMESAESYYSKDNWPPEGERAYLLRLVSEVPVQEDTLMRLLVIGLYLLRLVSEVPVQEDTLMRLLVTGLSRDLPLSAIKMNKQTNKQITLQSRYLLRLVSEVPVQEDTLMRLLVIGLSRDLPLSAVEALDLADQVVRRAASLHSPDFDVLPVERIQLVDAVLNLCAYHHPENIQLPQGYEPPTLAISNLYWKGWMLLLTVSAFNPANIGHAAWEHYPQLKCFMEMVMTNDYDWPPGTLATEEKKAELINKELQICELEKQEILEFESHLAAASTKVSITEANSLLIAQLISMDPRYVNNHHGYLSGVARRPPPSILQQLRSLNKSLKLGHLLCRCRAPDFLLDIIQRQGTSQSMPWLAELVESSEGSMEVLPVQCLCEFLLHDIGEEAAQQEDEELLEMEKSKMEMERLKQKSRKQDQLRRRLQTLLYGPDSQPNQTHEVLQYFLRRLGAQQRAGRNLAAKGAQQRAGRNLAAKGAQQRAGRNLAAKGAQQRAGRNLAAKGAQQRAGRNLAAKPCSLEAQKRLQFFLRTLGGAAEGRQEPGCKEAHKRLQYFLQQLGVQQRAGRNLAAKTSGLEAHKRLQYFLQQLEAQQRAGRNLAAKALSMLLAPRTPPRQRSSKDSSTSEAPEQDKEMAAAEEEEDAVTMVMEEEAVVCPPELKGFHWLLVELPKLPHFNIVLATTVYALRQACQTETDPMAVSAYMLFLSQHAPPVVSDMADLALDMATVIVERPTIIAHLMPRGVGGRDGGLGGREEADIAFCALLAIYIQYFKMVLQPQGEPAWSESQDQIFLRWSTGEGATMHILVVHAMIILLTYGEPRGDNEYNWLLEVWFPIQGQPPAAYLVDTSEEALLLPDWLKLRMIRSHVQRLVDAALLDLDPAQLVLFVQSFGIPMDSMSKLLICLDEAVTHNPLAMQQAVVDKAYMSQLVEVQHMRGVVGGEKFKAFLNDNGSLSTGESTSQGAVVDVEMISPVEEERGLSRRPQPSYRPPSTEAGWMQEIVKLFPVDPGVQITSAMKKDIVKGIQLGLSKEISAVTRGDERRESLGDILIATILQMCGGDYSIPFTSSLHQNSHLSCPIFRLLMARENSHLSCPIFRLLMAREVRLTCPSHLSVSPVVSPVCVGGGLLHPVHLQPPPELPPVLPHLQTPHGPRGKTHLSISPVYPHLSVSPVWGGGGLLHPVHLQPSPELPPVLPHLQTPHGPRGKTHLSILTCLSHLCGGDYCIPFTSSLHQNSHLSCPIFRLLMARENVMRKRNQSSGFPALVSRLVKYHSSRGTLTTVLKQYHRQLAPVQKDINMLSALQAVLEAPYQHQQNLVRQAIAAIKHADPTQPLDFSLVHRVCALLCRFNSPLLEEFLVACLTLGLRLPPGHAGKGEVMTQSHTQLLARMLMEQRGVSAGGGRVPSPVSGLLVDWLETSDTEIVSTCPDHQLHLLFARDGGRSSTQPYLLALLTHQTNYDTLHRCIDFLLQGEGKDRISSTAALDFLWACIHIPKVWQGRDTKVPQRCLDKEKILQLRPSQLCCLVDYILQEAGESCPASPDDPGSLKESLSDSIQARLPLLLSCCHGNKKEVSAEVLAYLQKKMTGQDKDSVVAMATRQFLLLLYIRAPHMHTHDSVSEVISMEMEAAKGGYSQLDSFTHRLLSVLGNCAAGKVCEDRMYDTNILCRKLATVHPALLLRQLPMIAALLRGRVHLNFDEFVHRHHFLFFTHVLGLLELLVPHVFRKEHPLEDVLESYFDLLKEHYSSRRELGALVNKVIQFLHQFTSNDPQRAVALLQKHSATLHHVSKQYPDLSLLKSLLAGISLPSSSSDSVDETSSSSSKEGGLPETGRASPIPLVVPPASGTPWTAVQLAPFLKRIKKGQDHDDVLKVLHDLELTSKRRVDVLEHFLADLKRLMSDSHDDCRNIAHNLVMRHIKSKPSCAAEFLDSYLHCLDTNDHNIIKTTLRNLADYIVLCQEHSNVLVRKAFAVGVQMKIDTSNIIADAINMLRLEGYND